MKNCSNPVCAEQNPQPLNNFPKDKRVKDGFGARCKKCRAKQLKEARLAEPEIFAAYDKKYYRSAKGQKTWKNRGKSEVFKKYQKQYSRSSAGKRSQARYRASLAGKVNILWHAMNKRCRENKRYEDVEVKMNKEEWTEFATPAILAFWQNNPTGVPSVHRKNDEGHYALGNIEIIDKNENLIRSSFLVNTFHLDKCLSMEENLPTIKNILKESICNQLNIDFGELLEALRD